jgi:hypothetical protein
MILNQFPSILFTMIFRPDGAMYMAPQWGYEHGAPMELEIWRIGFANPHL